MDNTVMEAFYSYSYLIAVVASVTLTSFMMGLNLIFKRITLKLTEWEYPRTQELDSKILRELIEMLLYAFPMVIPYEFNMRKTHPNLFYNR